MDEVLMWYFPLLRYDFDEDNFMLLYHSDNISIEQEKFCEKFKIKYPDFILNQSLKSKADVYDWSYKFLKDERRNENEYRRI